MLRNGVVENNVVALVNLKIIILDIAKTNLRALEILNDRNMTTVFIRSLANPTDKFIHFFVTTMREVKAAVVETNSD